MHRRRLLADTAGIVLPDDLGPAGRAAAVDDVLDAAAAAWTARRVAHGQARPLPDPPDPSPTATPPPSGPDPTGTSSRTISGNDRTAASPARRLL
jgi:hypothetical protein